MPRVFCGFSANFVNLPIRWLNPTEDERKLVDEYKAFAKKSLLPVDRYRLLRALASSLRIEPLLLRNARLYFAPAGDIEWETELWFSYLIRSPSAKSALMREGSERLLADDLRSAQGYGSR
jgi:hypothetical protein